MRETVKQSMRFVTLLLFVLAVACAGPGPRVTYLSDARYEPTLTVDRLRADPARSFDVIAELDYVAHDETRREVESLLAEKARRLGANAVIFDERDTRATRPGVELISSQQRTGYQARAIRYR